MRKTKITPLGEIVLGSAVYAADPASLPGEFGLVLLQNVLPGRYRCQITRLKNDAFHAEFYTKVMSLEICHTDFDVPALEELPFGVDVDSGEAGFFDAGYFAQTHQVKSCEDIDTGWMEQIYNLHIKQVPNPDYLDEEIYLCQMMGSRYHTKGELSSGALTREQAEAVQKERLNLSFSYQDMLSDNPILGRRTFEIGCGGTRDNRCCVAQSGYGDGGCQCFVGRSSTGQIVSAKLVFIIDASESEADT